jgi:caspase domain-containing protein
VELADSASSRAVMIGASAYRSPLHDLPAVANNLIRLKELLTDAAIWGLREEHCRLIGQDELSEPGARATALDAIYEAAHAATDLLLVYYAGHGLLDPDDAFYLALPDTDELRPHTALEYAAIRQVLSSTSRPRNTVVILDCCFAARAMSHGLGGNLALAGRQVAREGTYLLAAAAETKPARAEPGQRYTAFTAELIDALALGIPSAGPFLDLETLFEHLSSVLSAKGYPVPQAFNRNHGARIVLGRNRGFTGPDWSMPPALAGFLQGQVRAADDFPYRLAGARSFGLTTVYIRQKVTSPSGPASDDARRRHRCQHG